MPEVHGTPGRLSSGQVRELQRARIVEAMARVAAERGFGELTTTRVVERAGVSRATFYELFESLEACFLVTLDTAMRRSLALVAGALELGGLPPERVTEGLAALLGFFEQEPAMARVCVVEALAAGPAALAYRARELEVLKHQLDAACGAAAGDGSRVSLLGTEAGVAVVAGILHARIVTGEAPPFLELLAPLTGAALAPYLDGHSLALEIRRAERLTASLRAARSQCAPQRGAVEIPSGLRNPSAHRARLCVLYLAEHPGVSNRTVAERVGISHYGQVSALLTRLAREGLLAKRAGGSGRPNSWRLTPRGEHVAQALSSWAIG